MKFFLFSAILLIIVSKLFGQSLTFNELIDVYNSPQNKINTYLVATKHFHISMDNTPPTVGLMRYIKNNEEQGEETVINSSGTLKPDGTYIPHLSYIATDSLYFAEIQKQIEDLRYISTGKKSDAKGWECDYVNDEFVISLIHYKGKEYVLNLKRKEN